MVDAQAAFTLDGHTREPLRIGFTERAAGSLELPARAATAAREQTLVPGGFSAAKTRPHPFPTVRAMLPGY